MWWLHGWMVIWNSKRWKEHIQRDNQLDSFINEVMIWLVDSSIADLIIMLIVMHYAHNVYVECHSLIAANYMNATYDIQYCLVLPWHYTTQRRIVPVEYASVLFCCHITHQVACMVILVNINKYSFHPSILSPHVVWNTPVSLVGGDHSPTLMSYFPSELKMNTLC